MKLYDKNKHKYVFINSYYKDNNGLKINVCANCNAYWIILNGDDASREMYNSKDTCDENFNKAYQIASKKYNLIHVSDKEELLEYIEAHQEPDNRRNLMGCLETWYDAFYAIKETFTKEQVEVMTDNEINNLLSLACNIQNALY